MHSCSNLLIKGHFHFDSRYYVYNSSSAVLHRPCHKASSVFFGFSIMDKNLKPSEWSISLCL